MAGALEHSCCLVCGLCQCRVHGAGEIELSVAVCIRARELEKRLCRRMQYVRLKCRCIRACTLELQFKAQILDGWKRDTQCDGGCPIATQPVHALLACGGAGTREAHAPLPEVLPEVGPDGAGDVPISDWVVSRLSPGALGRADRRCCFSC
jgi:hypothetical protein